MNWTEITAVPYRMKPELLTGYFRFYIATNFSMQPCPGSSFLDEYTLALGTLDAALGIYLMLYILKALYKH